MRDADVRILRGNPQILHQSLKQMELMHSISILALLPKVPASEFYFQNVGKAGG